MARTKPVTEQELADVIDRAEALNHELRGIRERFTKTSVEGIVDPLDKAVTLSLLSGSVADVILSLLSGMRQDRMREELQASLRAELARQPSQSGS